MACSAGKQQIVRRAARVPALDQNRAGVNLRNLARRGDHILRAPNAQAGECFGFGQIGGEQRRQGQKLPAKRPGGILFQQLAAAGGDHDRVDHDIFRRILPQFLRNDPNQRDAAHHADFDGIRKDIRKNAVQLAGQKFRRALQNAKDARGARVLRYNGNNDAHTEYAMGRKCL